MQYNRMWQWSQNKCTNVAKASEHVYNCCTRVQLLYMRSQALATSSMNNGELLLDTEMGAGSRPGNESLPGNETE